MMLLKQFIFLLIFFFPLGTLFAYVPIPNDPDNVSDVVDIQNPEEEKMFFGHMNSFPHTFEIDSKDSFNLYVEIRVPDIESSKNNISGIIVKENEGSGSVSEVARLPAKSVEWESLYEKSEGDHYRVGPQFGKELGAGVYRVEVSTPDNIEKYVLIIGKEKSSEAVGYFEKVRRIAELKAFFGKSQFSIIESRTVYAPLIFVTLLALPAVFFVRRRRWRGV